MSASSSSSVHSEEPLKTPEMASPAGSTGKPVTKDGSGTTVLSSGDINIAQNRSLLSYLPSIFVMIMGVVALVEAIVFTLLGMLVFSLVSVIFALTFFTCAYFISRYQSLTDFQAIANKMQLALSATNEELRTSISSLDTQVGALKGENFVYKAENGNLKLSIEKLGARCTALDATLKDARKLSARQRITLAITGKLMLDNKQLVEANSTQMRLFIEQNGKLAETTGKLSTSVAQLSRLEGQVDRLEGTIDSLVDIGEFKEMLAPLSVEVKALVIREFLKFIENHPQVIVNSIVNDLVTKLDVQTAQ